MFSQKDIDEIIKRTDFNVDKDRSIDITVTGQIINNNIVKLTVEGLSLDITDSTYIILKLYEVVKDFEANLILDIQPCEKIFSLGVRTISKLAKKCIKTENKLIIINANPEVLSLLKLMTLMSLFESN